jgi:hypothetical protein
MKLVLLLPRKVFKTRARVHAQTNWFKSSLSAGNGDCIEVAKLSTGHIGVRDSKDINGPILRFTDREWDAFVGGVHKGEFDGISQRKAQP